MNQIFEGMTPEPCEAIKAPVAISCLAENLFKAMKEVQITKFHTLPVLNHVRLAIVDGYLELTTTDLEKINKAKCAIRENDNGYRWATCAPMVHKYSYSRPEAAPTIRKGYPFLDYLKVIKDFDPLLTLTFNPDVQLLTIKQGDSTTVFKCLDAMEFPPCTGEGYHE